MTRLLVLSVSIHRDKDRQTDRQTNRQTHTHTHTHTHKTDRQTDTHIHTPAMPDIQAGGVSSYHDLINMHECP